MKSCPNCESKLTGLSQGILTLCEKCNEWVLPYEIKDPKKKNYRDRNIGKFSSLPKAKTRLKPVSKKLNIKLKGYAASTSDQTPNEIICAKCGSESNLTKHHPYGRSGFTEDGRPAIEVWFWLCTSFGNRCHDIVHENPNEAIEQGWLQPEYRNQILTEARIKPWKK